MTFIEMLIFFVVVWILVHTTITRICKTIEHTNIAKSYDKYIESIGDPNKETIEANPNTGDN